MKKLQQIQQTLKASKDMKNTFGGFNYRSAEGIYEALKPLLREFNCDLVLSDHIENIGRIRSGKRGGIEKGHGRLSGNRVLRLLCEKIRDVRSVPDRRREKRS